MFCLCHSSTAVQGSKFHSSDRLRQVKMTVGQVEYLQDLSDGRLRISGFHISCIGFIYFRQVNDTFGQVIFTIHLPTGQVHFNLNYCCIHKISWYGRPCYNGTWLYGTHYIDGLVQDDSNSFAKALELLQSCTKPVICKSTIKPPI